MNKGGGISVPSLFYWVSTSMRKMYKKKKRSCALCKPHKMERAKRWSIKDIAKMKESDREIRDLDL